MAAILKNPTMTEKLKFHFETVLQCLERGKLRGADCLLVLVGGKWGEMEKHCLFTPTDEEEEKEEVFQHEKNPKQIKIKMCW